MGLNRNSTRILDIEGKRVVSKDHQKRIFLHRDLFFYNLFQQNPLIRTPEIRQVRDLNLQTYFIESEPKDLLQAAREWARVHSYFVERPIGENRLLLKHEIRDVVSYLFDNVDAFGNMKGIVRDRLADVELKADIDTVLHGDLHLGNMVTRDGVNYYFDFELGGIGHPARDIASLIISDQARREEIIDAYQEDARFDCPGLQEDTDAWLAARTAQLYLILSRRDAKPAEKERALGRLSDILSFG